MGSVLDTIKNIKYLIPVNIDVLTGPSLDDSCFLGEWCTPYDNAEQYNHIPVLPFIWDDRNKYEQAYFYTLDVFENVLIYLQEVINKQFGLDFDIVFYRRVLSPWLIHYIQQAYVVCLEG